MIAIMGPATSAPGGGGGFVGLIVFAVFIVAVLIVWHEVVKWNKPEMQYRRRVKKEMWAEMLKLIGIVEKGEDPGTKWHSKR